jgi:membrane-associated phospholipid phosphatase
MRSRLRHLPLPSWPVLLYWGALLGALYAFVELAEEVYEKEGFFFDQPILTWLNVHQSPPLTALFVALSFVGSVFVLGPLTLALVAALWQRSRRAAVFLVLGLGGAVALNYTVKALLARARPDLFPQLSPVGGFAFPSGHTMASTGFFLTLYLIVRRVAPRRQGLAATLGLLLMLGIGLSRNYLQVHYPSDVLAGWALSSAWVLGVNLWYARARG